MSGTIKTATAMLTLPTVIPPALYLVKHPTVQTSSGLMCN